MSARTDYEKAVLTQSCDIVRAEPGRALGGGERDSRKRQVQTGVRCRLQQPSQPRTVETGSRGVRVADWEALLPVGTDVRPSDELIVGGQTYEVQGSDGGRASAMKLTAYCTQKQN